MVARCLLPTSFADLLPARFLRLIVKSREKECAPVPYPRSIWVCQVSGLFDPLHRQPAWIHGQRPREWKAQLSVTNIFRHRTQTNSKLRVYMCSYLVQNALSIVQLLSSQDQSIKQKKTFCCWQSKANLAKHNEVGLKRWSPNEYSKDDNWRPRL